MQAACPNDVRSARLHDWGTVDDRELLPGERVGGRYEVVEPKGKGGMARVYRGIDLADGGAVALKFMRSDRECLKRLDPDEREREWKTLLARFEREVHQLGRLRFPGIPRLLGHGEHCGERYLAMEYIDGRTLYEILKQRSPLPHAAAAAVAVQVIDALAHVHALPLVHRDIKPMNIMIALSGLVSVVDLGIAKPLGLGVSQLTVHQSTLGSHGYKSPEQLMDRQPTVASDIYSLCCVLYLLFEGTPPHDGQTEGALRDQHLYEQPKPFGSAVPVDVAEVILRGLAKDYQDRPSLAEIREVMARHLPAPGDPPPSPRLEYDPTIPFRLLENPAPTTEAAGEDLEQQEDMPWVGPADLRKAMEAVQVLLDSGDPAGDEVVERIEELARLALLGQQQLGLRRAVVRDALFLAADGLRAEAGAGRHACRLYEGIARDLTHANGPEERAAAITARLRAAECRLDLGESAPTLAALREAAQTTAELPPAFRGEPECARGELEEKYVARAQSAEQAWRVVHDLRQRLM
ncbi:serine/threonine protein kinase [Kitasatospora sp. NPDC059803]|uniref:serine/threonine protein kinase n=1 Tax=Kitasatospora sp. NPDC059803 TaxID=3346953 RepID=UPI00364F18D5